MKSEITALHSTNSMELEAYVRQIVHAWSKTLTLIGASLVPLFFILDYFMMPAALLPRFAAYRLFATAFVFVQYWVLRFTKPSRWSHIHGFVMSLVVGGTIALMTTHLGGFNSSYYAGLTLVILAVNLILPWRFTYPLFNSVMIIGLYVVLNVVIHQPMPVDRGILVNNMFFLSATSIITVAMAHIQHRLIRHEFYLRLDLKAARDALWGEMEIAKHIQTSLLPKTTWLQGYEIAATMLPASEVGGDYYDIVDTANGESWIAIGDVSGHGVESGLIMMMTQTSIRTAVSKQQGATPAQVLNSVNRVLKDNISRLGTDSYLTLTLLKLNGEKATFAGRHQDLLVYRSAHSRVETVPATGAWIGVMDDISAVNVDGVLLLGVGDVVLLYTDGVTEAMNKTGELFGDHRLVDGLMRYSHQAVENIVRNLVRDVQGHMAEQKDDISLVAIRRRA